MEHTFDEAWVEQIESTQVYKHDARSRVWRIDAPDGHSFVVKRFEYNPVRQALAAALGIHPGQRECRMARRLIRSDVPVIPIVASGYLRSRLGIKFWLATPHRGISLHNLFHHQELSDVQRRAGVIDAALDLTNLLSSKRYYNRDHKASNIIIDDQDRPWLIDVGAVRRSRNLYLACKMIVKLGQTLCEAGATEDDWAQACRKHGIDPNPTKATEPC